MTFSLGRRAAPSPARESTPQAAPPSRHVHERSPAAWVALALHAPAQRPASATRARVERATGADLQDARVHTGSVVDAATRALDADAFTVGRDVHIASTHHHPDTPAGERLLAHELTHVAQQGAAEARNASPAVRPADDTAERVADAVAGGARLDHGVQRVPPAVQRQVAQKETTGVTFTAADVQKLQTGDYWTQKLLGVYAMSVPLARFTADTEERDAVLSAVWSEHTRRGPLTSTVVRVITIPKRAGAASPKELAYRLEFAPAAKGAADARPTLDVRFLAEGPGAVSVAPKTPATAPSWPSQWNEGGFPTGGLKAYATAHADEVNQLLSFVNATKPGTSFTQVVETTTASPAHATTFTAEGSKDATGTLTALTVRLIAQRSPAAGTVPADYAKKDRADLEIEREQAKSGGDKLGTIKGLATQPADEQFAVKFALLQYFTAGKARNTEVDAIVPLPDGKRRILYTFRFQPGTNDVTVERIGEEGTGATVLDPATHRLDITRAQGFEPAFGTDVGKLKTWLAKRYPGITPSGVDAAGMIADANKQLNASAGTAAWFTSNYSMPVLDKTAGATRLQTAHGLDVGQTAGMKDYDPAELRLVEWGLEMLSGAMLGIVKGINLVRQAVKLGKHVVPAKTKGGKSTITYPPAPKTLGESFMTGAERTVAVFDSVTMGTNSLFIGQAVAGGDPRVAPISAMTVVHELGHHVGWSGGSKSVRDAFNATFVNAAAKLKTAPVTWYAASSPSDEFFPEAFAIFEADPEWMQQNLPDMFAWLTTLTTTGKPPP